MYIPKVSFNTIIPDEDQNILLAVRESLNRGYWLVGDIANRDYLLAMENGLPVTRNEVYAAVGFYAGVGGRTVRYYADVSAFYPPDQCYICGATLTETPDGSEGRYCSYCQVRGYSWREKYEDILTFSHYAHAMQFRDNDRWKVILEEAATSGRYEDNLSVDAMMARHAPPPPPAPEDFPKDVPGLEASLKNERRVNARLARVEVEAPRVDPLEPFYRLATALAEFKAEVEGLPAEDQATLEQALQMILEVARKLIPQEQEK